MQTAMRSYTILLILISTSLTLKAQQLNSLKTDTDCLNFIRTLYGHEEFYFDSAFTESEIKDLGLGYKNWQILDFNNDKKPDLCFVGKHKNRTTDWYSGYLYLSGNTSYSMINLFRFNDGYYSPAVYFKKHLKKNLLIVYLFDLKGNTKIDSLITLRKDQYPEGIRVVDTLIYKHDNVINFSSSPSNIEFDSLVYTSHQMEIFTVYNNSTVKYVSKWYGPNDFEDTFSIAQINLKNLQDLIGEIDLKTTTHDNPCRAFDQQSVKLRIFTKTRVIDIKDCLSESTFTLKAVYKFFDYSDLISAYFILK